MKKPSVSAQIIDIVFPYACDAYIAGKSGEDFPFSGLASSFEPSTNSASVPYTKSIKYILNAVESSLLLIYIEGIKVTKEDPGVAFCCPKEDAV